MRGEHVGDRPGPGLERRRRVVHHRGVETHPGHDGEDLALHVADVDRAAPTTQDEPDPLLGVRRDPEVRGEQVPVPPGRIARAASVPGEPLDARARTVPSPPLTNTTSAPSSTACAGLTGPRVLGRRLSHTGSGQPASASRATIVARSSSRPSTRFGLTITAVRRGPRPSRCSAAGWVVASWGIVTVASVPGSRDRPLRGV